MDRKAEFVNSLSRSNISVEYFYNNVDDIFDEVKDVVESPGAYSSVELFNALKIILSYKKAEIVFNDISINKNNISADLFVNVINNVGLGIIFDDISVLKGILIGVSSHSRKNKSGKFAHDAISRILRANNVEFVSEYVIELDGRNKRVDFAIFNNGELAGVIESSYYSSNGSKIYEVFNAYKELNNLLDVPLVWVLDGQGVASSDDLLDKIFASDLRVFNLQQLEEVF